MFSGNAWHLLALRCLWWCKKLKEDWECRINGCSHVFRQCLTFVERERKIWKRIGYVRLTVVYMFYGNAWHLLALRWIWWCKNLKEDWECRITGCLHVFRQCLTSVSITLSLMMQKVERGLECRIKGCSHVFCQCLTSVSITLSLMMQKVERGLGMSD